MSDVQIDMTTGGSGIPYQENGILAKRPYVNQKGQSVIAVNTGIKSADGRFIYREQRIQANATLRYDEWKRIDDVLLEAFQERLIIIDDLRSAGLTYNVGGLGVMVSEYETVGEMTDADVTMDGDTVVEKDRVGFGIDVVPIPIIHKDFQISERALLASRTRGSDLETTNAAAAARAVARTSEDMVFNGLNIKVGGYGVQGLLNKTGRPLQLISNWAAGGTSAETIYSEIQSLISEAEANRAYGPYILYIPQAYSGKFRADFKANSDKSLRQRVLDDGLITDIRVSDSLPDGNVILIQMTSSTIDLAVASDITTVQWTSGSGMTHFFKTYAAWAPRIKTDADGRFGYVHGATST